MSKNVRRLNPFNFLHGSISADRAGDGPQHPPVCAQPAKSAHGRSENGNMIWYLEPQQYSVGGWIAVIVVSSQQCFSVWMEPVSANGCPVKCFQFDWSSERVIWEGNYDDQCLCVLFLLLQALWDFLPEKEILQRWVFFYGEHLPSSDGQQGAWCGWEHQSLHLPVWLDGPRELSRESGEIKSSKAEPFLRGVWRSEWAHRGLNRSLRDVQQEDKQAGKRDASSKQGETEERFGEG